MYTYTQTKRHALHINTHTPSPPLPLSVCLMITPDEVCDFTTQLVRVGVACRGIGAAKSTQAPACRHTASADHVSPHPSSVPTTSNTSNQGLVFRV